MQLIPAIDIRMGHCVRLRQGDPDLETRYAPSPVETAWRFYQAKIEKIHIVDLDGAFGGTSVNKDVIAEIVRLPVAVELGGGIRTLAQIDFWLAHNVAQVILGTVAIEQPQLVQQAIETHGSNRIIVGLDARDGWIASQGWQTISKIKTVDLARKMVDLGVERFIYTDIATDGMFTGPNLAHLTELAEQLPVQITASGGIRDLEHLQALKKLRLANVDSVIVGRAIYEGQLDVAEAVQLLRTVN